MATGIFVSVIAIFSTKTTALQHNLGQLNFDLDFSNIVDVNDPIPSIPSGVGTDKLNFTKSHHPYVNITKSQRPPDLRPIPLVVTNNCDETIWPGLATQNGLGPTVGGFELAPGKSKKLYVSADWQGRVWGRTNCSFNDDGSGPRVKGGLDGNGKACLTGDCNGRVDCRGPVSFGPC